jgi:hypothetical protein
MMGRLEGRGRGSGVQVEAPFGLVVDFRGNRISRSLGYSDHGEASQAASLSE